jgi:hypothetical protein
VATNTTNASTPTSRYTRGCARRDSVATLTIKDVVNACGMPQPVIAQLVDRQWVDGQGWMYTQQHLQQAVEIADTLRKEHQARRSSQHVTETAITPLP